ncbi:hypothetical protein SAMN05421759_11062 [Roseivivax lentus]|uniref:Phage protein D n=1 Tax=Roseivivax lentus TaxID=633194 RepID=A0A1N7NU32_9RHOB|nr:hypothetical protein [Roseivivax lentus]SIT01873.1 hypothetical protein SAMN05421759_11062 [Roseivivax lentus]
MLDDLLGAGFSVMAGQGVPRPLPLPIMEQFVSAEIAISDSERSGFELVFSAVRSPALAGVFPVMVEPALKAGARVVLTSVIGIRPEVLMDGIVETAEFKPSEGDGPAMLHVRGKDLTFAMDREEREVAHPAQGPGEIAALVLLGYARLGVVPLVIPPSAAERPNPIDRVPMQRGTDYAYLSELAEAHDSIFTLIPGPAPLTSVAYWGPKPRIGVPQRAITTDMGPENNVSGLSFENAASEAANVAGQVQDRQSGQSVPVQSVAPQRPPLAQVPALANAGVIRRNLFRASGAQSAAQAVGEAQSQSDATTDVVTVKGDLDTGRYGAVLQTRGLVGMRGAGLDHDGLYYVQSVVHKISRGAWLQSFTLNREGTGTNVPVVLP